MRLFRDSDRDFSEAMSHLAHTNPFLPERIECEQRALGDSFQETARVWVPDTDALVPPDRSVERVNVALLGQRAIEAADRARGRLDDECVKPEPGELQLYEDLVNYALYAQYEQRLYAPTVDETPKPSRLVFYRDFARDFSRYFDVDGVRFPSALTPEHAFAIFFQIRRAFHYTFRFILGSSLVAARLRAETWHSVFTYDLRRYQRGVYRRMHDIPTLITGPSGTGKDLVAQAIGLSRYIAFDSKRMAFSESVGKQYHALSLSALSPTLIESELFGHRRGAFTGAIEDRSGWLETCGPDGTVFLDEIGELDAEIQVKLLRVLQSRTFQRIGETQTRMFLGKIIAATNRDLDVEMREGRFRDDLYYRLCADRISTPTLRSRIADDPGELPQLVRLLADRIGGEENGEVLASEVVECIERDLGHEYEWPGNVREVEQCVRNVMVRRAYRPPETPGQERSLDRALDASGLSADELLDRYCTLMYANTGSYVEAGRRLGLDRRTVKDRIDEALLESFGRTP